MFNQGYSTVTQNLSSGRCAFMKKLKNTLLGSAPHKPPERLEFSIMLTVLTNAVQKP